jgi:Na+/serine symporter
LGRAALREQIILTAAAVAVLLLALLSHLRVAGSATGGPLLQVLAVLAVLAEVVTVAPVAQVVLAVQVIHHRQRPRRATMVEMVLLFLLGRAAVAVALVLRV